MQCPDLTVGKTYTYSVYVKTQNVTSSTDGGARIEAVFNDGSAIVSEPITGTTDPNIDGGWHRISMKIPVTKEFDRIGMGFFNATGGTVYFSNPQVEEGEVANRYNLIENSGFEFNNGNLRDGTPPYNWTKNDGTNPGDYSGLEMAWAGTGRKNSYSARFDGACGKNKGNSLS